MSSRPHVTPHAEKPSRPAGRPSGLETTATNYCPHCGGELDRSLAQHMAQGVCEQHRSRNEEPRPKPNRESEEYPEPPLLDEHDEREHEPIDIDERRDLADELADAGVWPAE